MFTNSWNDFSRRVSRYFRCLLLFPRNWLLLRLFRGAKTSVAIINCLFPPFYPPVSPFPPLPSFLLFSASHSPLFPSNSKTTQVFTVPCKSVCYDLFLGRLFDNGYFRASFIIQVTTLPFPDSWPSLTFVSSNATNPSVRQRTFCLPVENWGNKFPERKSDKEKLYHFSWKLLANYFPN